MQQNKTTVRNLRLPWGTVGGKGAGVGSAHGSRSWSTDLGGAGAGPWARELCWPLGQAPPCSLKIIWTVPFTEQQEEPKYEKRWGEIMKLIQRGI